MRTIVVATVVATAAMGLVGCLAPQGTPGATVPAHLSKVGDAPVSAAAAKMLNDDLVVLATDEFGNPMPDVVIESVIERGGGQLTPAAQTTDADGKAKVRWFLGPVPVDNRLRVTAAGTLSVTFDTMATLDPPWTPAAFGDVDAYLASRQLEGSTEDLVFDPANHRVLIGVAGALVAVDKDGKASDVALTGDKPGWPLGLQFDATGNLWSADGTGKTLLKITTEGVVSTVAGGKDQEPLGYPNDVTVGGPKNYVYLTDTCGKVLGFNPSTGALITKVVFDTKVDAGPNGIVFSADGKTLYVSTENAALMCGDGSDATVANGGLFAFNVNDDGTLGDRRPVVTDFANFGDGMAFDAEGNLYVVFDKLSIGEAGIALAESAVWVLPSGGTELKRFLATTDRAMANLAWGVGEFGEQTLYLAEIAMPVILDPSMRGLLRFDTKLNGQPLLKK